jgi:hypothetical protein
LRTFTTIAAALLAFAVGTIATLLFASGLARAQPFVYSCKLDGKTYPLLVYEDKHVLVWMGRKYTIAFQPDCAKYGWHARGYGMSFDFCTATKGYAAIEDKAGNAPQVECDLKNRH